MPEKHNSMKHLRALRTALIAACAAACIALAATAVFADALALRVAAAVSAAVVLLASWYISRHAVSLHNHVSRHVDAAHDAEEHYFGVLCEVMSVVESRDRFLAGRSRRMSFLVTQIASEMNMPADKITLLGKIARIHDIGLLSVPAEVISKAGGLSNLEFSVVKRHCQVGCHILQPLKCLRDGLDAVLYHHERMNGTGYPEGLKGDNIPIEARIMAVADSFDAMTHDRPHRGAMLTDKALSEIIRCADAGYDRQVVIALARSLRMEEQLPTEWDVPAKKADDAPADSNDSSGDDTGGNAHDAQAMHVFCPLI